MAVVTGQLHLPLELAAVNYPRDNAPIECVDLYLQNGVCLINFIILTARTFLIRRIPGFFFGTDMQNEDKNWS